MTTPEVRVGVRLPLAPVHLGDWQAEAKAFDAAGAHSLWLDGADGEMDPVALAGALAAVTSRVRLVLAVEPDDLPAARAIETVRRISRDRLWLLVPEEHRAQTLAVFPGLPIVARVPAATDGAGEAIVAEHRTEGGLTERWLAAPVPEGRESWRETCLRAAAREAVGVVVDADEVLLSILRNPRPMGDRRDLNVASG